MTRYLVTSALKYANGPLHLGHILEDVQADVFVRALRMAGEDVMYVCGADSHGTPIEINAAKAGVAPEVFVNKWQAEHEKSFAKFDIVFDGGYNNTHSTTHQKQAEMMFAKLQAANHITVREVEQLYDEKAGRFLPDRFVRGTCPKCKTVEQYGDGCEACGSTYKPTDLLEPKSIITDSTPVLRSSKHYFFELNHYTESLKKWTATEGVLKDDVQRFLAGWFAEGLKDWDISRDGPYFGFPIPGEPNKYFYVWLDAPIGYISFSDDAAKQRGLTFADYWLDRSTKIIHFIGKDIIYFHTLFWPAMLTAANFNLPSTISVHGMLTINGEKMSKSRGTFILADQFSARFDTQSFRYYLASKLTAKIEDIDLSFDDFVNRVNSDVTNKIVNIISRTVPLLHKYCEGKPGVLDPQAQDIVETTKQLVKDIQQKYLERDSAQAIKDIVQIADLANRYLQERAPWDTAKTDIEKARQELTTALWLGKVCIGLLFPVVPRLAEQTRLILKLVDPFMFQNILDPLDENTAIGQYERLFERIDMKQVTEMIEAGKEKKSDGIEIDDFMKVDLRAAKVLESAAVEGSDKLIALKLDVGALGQRYVFTGLRPHVEPQDLLGKMVALVANLNPRKMRFGTSEGMILASGETPPKPVILDGATPGDRIR